MTLNPPRERCDQSADGPARGRPGRGVWIVRIVLVGLCALSLLGACAVPRPAGDRAEPAAAPTATRNTAAAKPRPPDLTVPPAAQWGATGQVQRPSRSAAEPAPAGPQGPAFTPFSQNLPDLRREVALICGSVRGSKKKDALAPLVTDLYRSGVAPALAIEALIQGDCGSLGALVTELVAQGGNEAVTPVVNRAQSLSGPRFSATIRAAAAAGLAAAIPPAPPPVYGMAYFPSGAAEFGVATAATPKTLYSNATPGYGIYTFVLLGGGFNPAKEADRARYAELLRVIETYVLAGEKGARTPRVEVHTFLIATHPEPPSAPDPSAAMRSDLTAYLKRHDQSALAERLKTLPGPFLISSLEPRLLPGSAAAPRLLIDLSGIGPGYLYAVVDAYDRPIPPEQQGRPEGLSAIRDRLLGLFSRQVPPADLSAALTDAWVFLLGGPPPVAAAPLVTTGAHTAEPGAPAAEPGAPASNPAAPASADPAASTAPGSIPPVR